MTNKQTISPAILRHQKAYLLFFCLFFCSNLASSQTPYLIRLTDKGHSSYSLQRPKEFLSEKSIERRSRYNISLDETDLPVHQEYLQAVANIAGASVNGQSKWLNALMVYVENDLALQQVQQLPFVQRSFQIGGANFRLPEGFEENKFGKSYPIPQQELIGQTRSSTGILSNRVDYGSSSAQILIHEGESLHNLGFRGEGITIAMFDAGYSGYLNNPAFDSIRLGNQIIGGYDFVSKLAIVSPAHAHGSSCLSVIAANRPGQLVGSATGASFWLLRTEDASIESPAEEFYWAQAAEFADSVGADIISSSLGYISFDKPQLNYTYAMRDGNTGISTIAADLAAKKGILVINSAGNTGGLPSDERFISCPADGDSVVAIGAIRSDKQIAGFSSWGPNANGKVKPNLVSVGQGTILANAQGNPVAGNGTSFSAPNLSGLFACLWQAFPEFSNMDIIQVVQESADRYLQPDIRYGYGIPSFKTAYQKLAQLREEKRLQSFLQNLTIQVYPNPFSKNLKIAFKARKSGKASIQIIDQLGRVHHILSLDLVEGQTYLREDIPSANWPPGLYYIAFRDGQGLITLKALKY